MLHTDSETTYANHYYDRHPDVHNLAKADKGFYPVRIPVASVSYTRQHMRSALTVTT